MDQAKDGKIDSGKPEISRIPVATPSPNDSSKELKDNSKPKEVSKKKFPKGCCIAMMVVFFLYFILPFIGFGFFSLFGSSRGNSFIPNFSTNQNPTSTPIVTGQTTVTNQPTNKASASKSSTTSKKSTPTPVSGSRNPTLSPTRSSSSTSTPSPTVTQPVVYTKQQQIDFFVQVAMKNDQNNFATIPIQKWTKLTGTVKYFGSPTQKEIECADSTISIINGLSHTIQFQKTDSDHANVRLYFEPRSQIGMGADGYYNYSTDVTGAITGGDAHIPNDIYPEADLCHITRHEMTHVMTGLAYNGLKNHGGYDFSIFNVTAGKSDYLDIDKYAIKIMLNSGVGLGWTETQVRNFLANASW